MWRAVFKFLSERSEGEICFLAIAFVMVLVVFLSVI